jgi:hypothetical protein
MAAERHQPTPAPRAPRGRESDRLLSRIRRLVSETRRLRSQGANPDAVRRREREIDRVRDELADVIRRDPTGGRDAWGRTA